MESALTVLAFLLGHCWQTPLPDRAIDTHCFTEEKPGALVRDRHAVRKDGKIVYTGETAFTIAPSGVLRFHYTGSTGADIEGPMHADGGKIVLTGMAVHRVLVEDASKLAGEVSGVKEVQNRMVVVHGPRAFT